GLGYIGGQHQLAQFFAAEAGLEFVTGVMVVDTVGEPYTLGIHHEGLELCAAAVAREVFDHLLQHAANTQVMTVVLVPHDVAAAHAGLGQIPEQRFFLQAELFKAWYAIAKNTNVSETIGFIDETLLI